MLKLRVRGQKQRLQKCSALRLRSALLEARSKMAAQENATLAEWGWRAAIGFIVTGALGLIALSIRKMIPVLGERLHRVYGERAFKAELAIIAATSQTVHRMEPMVERTSEQVDRLESRVETGFLAMEQAMQKMSDNLFSLAKEFGRNQR